MMILCLFDYCFPICDPISNYLILKQEREKFAGDGIWKGPVMFSVGTASVMCLAIL